MLSCAQFICEIVSASPVSEPALHSGCLPWETGIILTETKPDRCCDKFYIILCEVDRGGGPSLVGVCRELGLGSDQSERGMLVGGSLSKVVDLEAVDGVSASGDRKRSSDGIGVCEDEVGFVQA